MTQEAPLFNEAGYIKALLADFDSDRSNQLAQADPSGFLRTTATITETAALDHITIPPSQQRLIKALAEASFCNLSKTQQSPLDAVPLFLLIDTLLQHLPDPESFPPDKIPTTVRAVSQTITTCQLGLINLIS